MAGDEQRADRRLSDQTDDVSADHHRPAAHPIGHHAAEQERADQRDRPGGKHEAEVRGRPRQIEDSACERDRNDAIAHQRHARGREHAPEVADPQGVEVDRRPHPFSVADL